MNYGYDSTTKNWKEERKLILAKALCKQLPCNFGWTPGGVSPYIEVDGLYKGVRIRKITNINEDDVDEFLKRADKIYDEVMKDE